MTSAELCQIGRYTLHRAIARGGMATIHYGRLHSEMGFARTVAIKRLHPEYASDPRFVTMLMDEARLAARIQHPNVAQTLDVIREGDEVLLVLEYVSGASLARIFRVLEDRRQRVPVPIAVAIVAGALRGVHAAHEARDEKGELLELIHRDLSPDNIVVDESGIPRVVDFGIAKARGRAQQATKPGGLKGKVAYMAPEQVHGKTSRRSDVFSMGVVLWEIVVGERLFGGASNGEILASVLSTRVAPPSARGVEVPKALESVLLQSLSRTPEARPVTALAMAMAIEAATPAASAFEVATWLQGVMAEPLEEQRRQLAEIERTPPNAVEMPQKASHHRRVVAVVAMVAAAVIGLLVVRLGSKRAPAEPPRAAEEMQATPASIPLPAPAPTTPESNDTPAPPPPSAPSSSLPAPRPEPRSRPPLAPARPRRSCDPPFTVDASGVRTWKRDCF